MGLCSLSPPNVLLEPPIVFLLSSERFDYSPYGRENLDIDKGAPLPSFCGLLPRFFIFELLFPDPVAAAAS